MNFLKCEWVTIVGPFTWGVFSSDIVYRNTPIAFELFDNNRDWWILRTIIIELEKLHKGKVPVKEEKEKKRIGIMVKKKKSNWVLIINY